MNTSTAPGLHAIRTVLRRRLPYVLGIAPPIVLAAVFLAFWIEPRYEATSTIMLQTSTVAKDVIGSTVVTYGGQQIEVVQGRVMTTETLTKLVDKYDPYPALRGLSSAQKAQLILQNTSIEHVDPVNFKPTTEDSGAFSLHYRNPDRERAAEVADRLSQLFLTYQQQSRAQAAREAAVFLEQQAEKVDTEIRSVDDELARLKNTQGDALPDRREQNEASAERTQRNLDSLQQEILKAEDKESQLSVQLSQMSPNLITQTGELSDLASVRAKLAEAEQRYTPDHPEVKRLKQAMQKLMAENSGRANSAPGGIVAGANNPQYAMAATELGSVRKQLGSLRAEKAREEGKLRNLESLLRRTPTVESSFSDIIRRRQSLQAEYQQTQEKLRTAQVAQNFETEQRGERFVMLRAPSVPTSPSFPNRAGFISLGLLLGLGLAAAVTAIVESTDTRVRDVGDLPMSDKLPLLATIPNIRNRLDLRLRRRRIFAVSAVYGVAVIAVGAVVMLSLLR